MAIFSNLDGTMKKSFVLGKNGGRLEYDTNSSTLKVQNYKGDRLIPVSAGEPTEPEHLVTLEFFNTHGTPSSNPILRGTTPPDVSLGVNGNVYFQVDEDSIIQISIKDNGVWKPFKDPVPPTDSDYVTSNIAQPSDFIEINGMFVYTLLESVHNRGAGILIQVQNIDGNNIQPEVLLDSTGNITFKFTDLPNENIIIKIIGKTSMTVPYSSTINDDQWAIDGDMYSITIPSSTHGQEIGPLYLAIYENVIDGPISVSPYSLVSTDSIINTDGNVTFKTYTPFSGKVVISGK